MKKFSICIFISVLLICSFEANASSSKNIFIKVSHTDVSDTLITILTSFNLPYYNGKPVDTLLAYLPVGVVELKITGWHSSRRAEILHVVYPNNIVVEIHVKNFQYMNPTWVNTSTPTQNWSVALFRKESIAYSVVFNGSKCINGCANEYK